MTIIEAILLCVLLAALIRVPWQINPQFWCWLVVIIVVLCLLLKGHIG